MYAINQSVIDCVLNLKLCFFSIMLFNCINLIKIITAYLNFYTASNCSSCALQNFAGTLSKLNHLIYRYSCLPPHEHTL